MHISQRFIYHKCYIYHKRFIYYKDSYTKFYIRNNHQVYMASCSDPAKIGKRSLFQHKQEVYRWALWGWGIYVLFSQSLLVSNKYISQSLLVSTEVNLSPIIICQKCSRMKEKRKKASSIYMKARIHEYLAFQKKHQNNI